MKRPKKRSFLFDLKSNQYQSKYEKRVLKKALNAYLLGFDFMKLHSRIIPIAAWN